MCYDPFEESVQRYAELYIQALRESNREDRSEGHRHAWAGKPESFAKWYPEKLQDELDDELLEEWLDEIEARYEGEERDRLLEPAEKEVKRRAEEAANVGT